MIITMIDHMIMTVVTWSHSIITVKDQGSDNEEDNKKTREVS